MQSVLGTLPQSTTATMSLGHAKHVRHPFTEVCPGSYYGNDILKACVTSKKCVMQRVRLRRH